MSERASQDPRIRLFVLALTPLAFACESNPDVPWRVDPPRVPGAPQLQSVEALPSAVSVAWSPNPAGGGVQNYTLLAASSPWTTWSNTLPDALALTTGGCCSITASGLDDEKTYWVGVRATNDAGDSPVAATLPVTPPGWQGTIAIATPEFDSAHDVAVAPNGDIFVTGWTLADFGGDTNLGQGDMFAARYRANGELLWIRLFGTPDFDIGSAIAVASDGRIVVAGSAAGPLLGQNYYGISDLVVMLLEPSTGDPVWVRQIGTVEDESIGDAVVVQDDLIIAGGTQGDLNGESNAGGLGDAFVMRVSLEDGSVEWTRLVGTVASEAGNEGVAVAPDSWIYLCGSTEGNLNGTNAGDTDAFVARISSGGVVDWIDQFGTTAADRCSRIVADEDVVVSTGATSADLDGEANNGMADVFVRKTLTTSPTRQWTRLIGGDGSDSADSIMTSAGQYVLVAQGSGGPSDSDVVFGRFDSDGNLVAHDIVGSPGSDNPWAAALTPHGSVLVAGETRGPLAGSTPGAPEGFILKFDPVGNVVE